MKPTEMVGDAPCFSKLLRFHRREKAGVDAAPQARAASPRAHLSDVLLDVRLQRGDLQLRVGRLLRARRKVRPGLLHLGQINRGHLQARGRTGLLRPMPCWYKNACSESGTWVQSHTEAQGCNNSAEETAV